MAFDQLLKKRFGIVLVPLVALAAFLNAQAVSQLVGVGLAPDEKQLATPPPVAKRGPSATNTTRSTSAAPILARNPFDHVTGPLTPPPEAEGDEGGGPVATVNTDDPYSVPECDGVNVLVIAASQDEDWSFAAVSTGDGKSQLRRRGGEIGGKKLYFVGWDRVWFESGGSLCQAKLFAKKEAAKPAATPTPTPVPSGRPARGAAKPLDPDIKKGIQKVSATEYNIDRGVVDKILENQAELMRQARVIPEQQNGRVVGIRLMNVKPGSLLGELGIQNGDRLQTINGFDMSSPEKALEAYARLRTADKLTVQVNRGGKDMNLDFNIK